MYLKGKAILVISPQEWSDFYISKHNYSIELSKLGNDVYFLCPPKKGNSWKGRVTETEFSNLKIIRYNTFFPSKIRFHLKATYKGLIRLQWRIIERLLPKSIDVVWCFEPNVFPDLSIFSAKLKIYHPVDFLTNENQIKLGENADIIFSVADNILQLFKNIRTPQYFINHGLSRYYSDSKIEYNRSNKDHISFAYIGSLFIPGLDREALTKVIDSHPHIQFDFYGRYQNSSHNSKEIEAFIQFLTQAKNTRLHGVLHPKELNERLKKYDGFILCYNPSKELNSGSNSHKILEYLSLGKVIVSSKLSAYEKYKNEILMSMRFDNADYHEIFDNAVKNIAALNTQLLFNERRKIALENTYKAQIVKIDNILKECV